MLRLWIGENRLTFNPSKKDLLFVHFKVSWWVQWYLWIDKHYPWNRKSMIPESSWNSWQKLWADGPFSLPQLACQLQLHLGWDNFATMTHAFIISHLDYCNTIHMEMPLKITWKPDLQAFHVTFCKLLLEKKAKVHCGILFYFVGLM